MNHKSLLPKLFNPAISRLLLLMMLALIPLSISAMKAYARYYNDSTLVFYYGNGYPSGTSNVFDLNTGSYLPGWSSISDKIKKVEFDPTFADARPTSTAYWFNSMTKLKTITGLEYLNTSEVTNMSYMFSICLSLTSLDLSYFNTEKVKNMSNMFISCPCSSLDLSSFNTANVSNMSRMFNNCKATTINLSSFNTANVTDMSLMFRDCSNMIILDLSNFNTSKVGYMKEMFRDCSALQTIVVSDSWFTENVSNSDNMFYGCTSLLGGMGTRYQDANPKDKTYAHIDGGEDNPGYLMDINGPYVTLSADGTTLTFYKDGQLLTRTETFYGLNAGSNDTGWDTDGTKDYVTKVVFDPSFADACPTTTYDWFFGMYNLQSITGISYLNTSEVTNMAYMFTGCRSLTSLDVSNFNTAKVSNMQNMFFQCNLTSLDLTSFNTSNVTNMRGLFDGCNSLATIYVGDGWSTVAVTNSDEMFYNCLNIVGGKGTTYDANHIDAEYAHIDGGTSNPGYLTDINDPYAALSADGMTLTFYKDGLRGKRTGTTYFLNEGSNLPGWYSDRANITNVVFDPSFAIARPTSTYWWFGNMEDLGSIEGIEYLNTSEVTNMSRMFSTCWSMESIDLSHFETGNVKDMSYMFNYCEALTSLDLSSFDTHNVFDMEGMFYECSSLTNLDLSSFNTENVHNFQEMFFDCAGLTSMDLRNFDTRNAESMNGMFLDCSGLTSIDLSSFNTEHVVDMSNMFAYCSGLTSLDLSSFNTSYLLLTNWMFSNCRNLVTIYVGDDWDASSLDDSEDMFKNCTSLVGGKGTTYDANHVDAEYAHIDGGTSNPGYFTDKIGGYTRGDVNGDGQVKINDVTALIDYLLSGDGSSINVDAADCNQDGQVKINDVTALIDYLLSGVWP